ncbi:MAG: hypothetical protein AAGB93_16680 [Planctomycetota bacterium]
MTGLLAAAIAAAATSCGGGGGGGGGTAPPNVPSVGGLTDTGHLADIAMASGAVTLRTGQGPLGFTGMLDVALDSASGVLYGIASESTSGPPMLVRIDPTAGSHGLATKPRIVAAVGPASAPSTLAWHPGEQRLYGVVAAGGALFPGRLVRIDPATGTSEDVGECAKVTTLTYDPVTDALYGIRGDGFHRIRPSDGASTLLFTQASLLPGVTALGLDPLTGVFRAAHLDPMTSVGPRMLTIDLFGSVDVEADVDAALVALEVHATSGAIFGLGTGGSIVALTPGAPAYGIVHRGNVGCELFDLALDRSDGGYFGIDTENHLVKLRLDGSSRTIGRVDVPTRKLVHDSDGGALWGIGSFDINSSTDQYVYEIDSATAETTTPVLTNLSVGTALTYDWTNGAIRGISGVNDVTIELDPQTGQASLTSNALALDDVLGVAWDAPRGRLVAITSDGPSELRRVISWDPFVSGPGTLELIAEVDARSLAPLAGADRFVALGEGGDMVEVALQGDAATLGAVRDELFVATAFVATSGRVLAVAGEDVYSIDPSTGATTHVGSTPSQDRPSSVTWDPENGQLGFLIDDEVRWTSPSAPWNSPTRTQLAGRSVRYLAFSADRGVFYLLGADGLFTLARNAGGDSFVQVDATPAPTDVTDVTWRDGALWAATADRRLHRIDPDSGAWTEVGSMRFGARGLY